MKKLLVMSLTSIMIISIFLLIGCGNNDAGNDATADDPSTEEVSGEVVTIEAIGWKSEAVDGKNELAADFNAKNPDIVVNFSTSTDYFATLQGRIAAGNPPDLIGVWSGNYNFVLVREGNLVEITDQPFLDNIIPDILEQQRIDGQIWSMPIDMAAVGIYYNRTVFEDLGLSVPTNPQEFFAVAEAIEAAGIVPVVIAGMDSWTLMMIYISIADALIYSDYPNFDLEAVEEGIRSYTDPEWEAVIETFLRIRDEVSNADFAVTDYSTANQMMAEGSAAMVAQGLWCVAAIQEFNPDADIGFFPFPFGSGSSMILGTDFTLGVSSVTEHHEESMRFLEYMSTIDAANIWTSSVQTFSSVIGSDMEFNSTASDINAFVADGRNLNPIRHHMWFCMSITSDVTAMLQELLAGAIPSDQFLINFDNMIREAYADFAE